MSVSEAALLLPWWLIGLCILSVGAMVYVTVFFIREFTVCLTSLLYPQTSLWATTRTEQEILRDLNAHPRRYP